MKTKLLLLSLLISTYSFSQAPINNYFSTTGSQYAIVNGTIDQSPTGANATWNFGTLAQSGTNTDTFTAPTAGELTSYPGTTQVLTISDGTTNSQAFYSVAASTLSLTGASNPDFTIDYNTDNALIGTYPLVFGDPVTNDAIAGQLMAQGQSPNYTGSIITEVNAYGTLNFNVTSQGSYSGSVTRIRTEQNIAFTVVIFPGTVSIVTNNYYKDTDGALVFRTTDGVISVPGVGINDSFSTSEALITNTLSVPESEFISSEVKLYPNPVEDVLNIDLNENLSIETINILDVNGRTVLSTNKNSRTINTSELQTGFYMLAISTEAGTITKKFIKE